MVDVDAERLAARGRLRPLRPQLARKHCGRAERGDLAEETAARSLSWKAVTCGHLCLPSVRSSGKVSYHGDRGDPADEGERNSNGMSRGAARRARRQGSPRCSPAKWK